MTRVPDLDPDGELPDMRRPWRSTTAADYFAAAGELRSALTDPDRRCGTLDGPGTAGWWARRQLHETLIHRFDLAQAVGAPWEADPPDGGWLLGPEPAAGVHGDASALALLLWRRIPLDDDRPTVTGDRAAAAAVLAEALVP